MPGAMVGGRIVLSFFLVLTLNKQHLNAGYDDTQAIVQVVALFEPLCLAPPQPIMHPEATRGNQSKPEQTRGNAC